ncbi:MAG: hypothetical protein AAF662_05815 [Pseudomonadota bacterium]
MINQSEVPEKHLWDKLKLLRRRRMPLLLSAATIFTLAFYYALTAPAVYESQATILVEDQSVSPNYVRSANTGFASEQVLVISQRVLTIDKVADIVNRYGLYSKDRDRPRIPSPKLERKFRRNMILELVSAETNDPRNFRKTEVTIAFELGFRAGDPEIARQITDELVALFIEENRRDRSTLAASTSEFLASEASRLNEELLDIERALADFKLANEGSLPEQYSFNLNALDQAQRKLAEMAFREQSLRTQRIELRTRLSGIQPFLAVRAKGDETVYSDVDRLRALQAEKRRKSAIYKETHPDLVRLTREISELQQVLGVGADTSSLEQQLVEQREELSKLRERYNENYFAVRNAQRVVLELEAKLREARSQATTVEDNRSPDNPAYLLVSSQIEAAETELASLQKEKVALEQRVERFEQFLRRAPNVEKDYNALIRNYETANEKYQDFQAKAREAAVATNLETEQKGERFIVVEPAVTPSDPISPDRKAIVIIGAVLALGVGVGLALAIDVIRGTVHGASEVASLIGSPPLAVVPYLQNDQELRQQQWMYRGGAVVAVAFVGLTVAAYLWRSMGG